MAIILPKDAKNYRVLKGKDHERKDTFICGGGSDVCFVSCSHQDSEEIAGEANAGFFAMNTYISMTAYGDQADSVLEEAESRMKELEALWSVTEETVIFMQSTTATEALLRSAMKRRRFFPLLWKWLPKPMAPWTLRSTPSSAPGDLPQRSITSPLTIRSKRCCPGGYEKIRLDENQVQLPPNMMLDLGALGKGYAGDTVIQLLKDRGILSALVDLGGNIQTIGMRPDGMPWRLGLQDPFGGENLGVLSVSDCAVVTSGNYEITLSVKMEKHTATLSTLSPAICGK